MKRTGEFNMRVVTWGALMLASLFATASLAQSSASPFMTGFRYDAARQLVGTIKPSAGGGHEAVRNTYDAEGRITKIERGVLQQWQPESVSPAVWPGFDVRYVTVKTYDVMGRLLSEMRPGPTLTQYKYDAVGRLECSAIRMNPAVYTSIAALTACQHSTEGVQGPDRITHFVYDDAGRVLNEQRAYGTAIQQNYATYAYTPNGRQDWVEDSNGNRTDYTYDGFDRISRMNFPQSAVGAHAASTSDYEQYGYDSNSNRTSKRLRSGETIGYQFDALNRVQLKDLPGSSNDVTYSYDNFGLNQSAQISGGPSISNTFNGFGQLLNTTSNSSSGSLQLSYLYDEDGNRTRVTWPDGMYVQYTYDGLNRIDQVRENGASSGAGLLADYSYDAMSRRTTVSRGNGTTTGFYYDGASRVSTLDQDLASTSRDLSIGFSYNNASQLTGRTLSNDAYSYFSLTQSQSYTPSGLNAYASVGGVAFGSDGRGNLTSDGSRTFTYDLENHLLSVSGGAASVSLTYDPDGRLLTTTSGVTTRYLYDGDRLAAEYNGSTLVRRYVHGASIDEPLVWYEGAGLTDRRWLHADHQGSVIASSNGSGIGTVYAYGPYGEPAYENWSGSRFRYTGQIMLPEAKLYHYKARVYDPLLGRFLQNDPIWYRDDFNLYAYVHNDPLSGADPTGMCTGSRIENDDGTCRSTGGSTTGIQGEAEGMQIARAAEQVSASMNVGSADAVGAAIARAPGTTTASEPGSPLALIEDAARRAIAKEPVENYKPWSYWLRGIRIHTHFAQNVRALGMDYRAEVSYWNKAPASFAHPGSIRADATYGGLAAPAFAVELKTAGAYLTELGRQQYQKHLPPGTILYEIREPMLIR
jgi:RHS repeat-associated protein